MMTKVLTLMSLIAWLATAPAWAAGANANAASTNTSPTANTNPTAAATDDDDDGKDTEISDILNSVGYPELQVVPRASERLRMEAKAERGNWFYAHWPIELSGFATMYVGLSAKSNRRTDLTDHDNQNADGIGAAATAIGASWMIGGLLVGADRPYTSGYRALVAATPTADKDAAKKDDRAALLRERLAEEALERPAKTMRVLQWASIISNFAGNAAVLPYSKDKGKVMAGIGMVLSCLPLMFNDRAIDIYDKHIEYKKKIYAPIHASSVNYDPTTKTWTPMENLVWRF